MAGSAAACPAAAFGAERSSPPVPEGFVARIVTAHVTPGLGLAMTMPEKVVGCSGGGRVWAVRQTAGARGRWRDAWGAAARGVATRGLLRASVARKLEIQLWSKNWY